jgi:hypothetical protein
MRIKQAVASDYQVWRRLYWKPKAYSGLWHSRRRRMMMIALLKEELY